MKLKLKHLKPIAEKYNMTYIEEDGIAHIMIPEKINIVDDDYEFLNVENDNQFSCAKHFGLETLKDGTFGFKTTYFDYIETVEELETHIRNFLKFMEISKSFERSYKEQMKINAAQEDFQ